MANSVIQEAKETGSKTEAIEESCVFSVAIYCDTNFILIRNSEMMFRELSFSTGNVLRQVDATTVKSSVFKLNAPPMAPL